jgi:hypothetical protein
MPYLQYVDWLFLKIWAFTGTTDTRSNIAAPTGSIGAIEFGGGVGIFGAYIFRVTGVPRNWRFLGALDEDMPNIINQIF